MSVALTENDVANLKEGLRRCSPETIAAAIRYREHADLDAIPTIVFGILARYQPATATELFLEGNFKDEPIFPASIVFEAMGQAACLWVLEKGPAQLGKEIKSNHVFFASLDGAHFYRKTKPGEKLVFEQKMTKLRE